MTEFRKKALSGFRKVAIRAHDAALPAPLRKAQVAWEHPEGPDRLVQSPVFLMSPTRSGSTLLRSILDSHSQICAPLEMHLNRLEVNPTKKFARKALSELGLTTLELENLLWDRVLHRQLLLSRKSLIVDKTPHNVFYWRRVAASWPRARYLYLLRHPASIVRSHVEARPNAPYATHLQVPLLYGEHIAEARKQLPGHLVRYEDLVTDPEVVMKGVCSWLGVRWERSMLQYGRFDHGAYKRQGTGDWSDNIRSGKIQPLRPPPATPPELLDIAREWGY